MATLPGGRLALQVKDVASPTWTAWFKQLADQVATLRRESKGDARVLGGVIVHKLRGHANPSTWRAILRLEDLADLLEATYQAGIQDASSTDSGVR